LKFAPASILKTGAFICAADREFKFLAFLSSSAVHFGLRHAGSSAGI
jgi:hypothetical protein